MLKYQLWLATISVLSLIGNNVHAECDPDYPDQFFFDVCNEVTALNWDKNNSVAELESNSSGTISIFGGQEPYTFTINGDGFYLNQAGTSKTVTTDSPSISIYSKDICGSGVVTVTDSCLQVTKGSIRANSGKWQQLVEPICGSSVDLSDGYRAGYRTLYEVVSGSYKTTQYFRSSYVSGSIYWNDNPYMEVEPICPFFQRSTNQACLIPVNLKCPTSNYYFIDVGPGFEYGGANNVGTYWNGTQYLSYPTAVGVSYEWVCE